MPDPKKSEWSFLNIVAVSAAAAILVYCVIFFLVGPFWFWPDDKERTILKWNDAEHGIYFEVTQRELLVKNVTTFVVMRNGLATSVRIDDDARFARASFVRWENWLLVTNNEYVLAGYDYDTGKLYGEYDWKELPFTFHTNQGWVVASEKVGDRAYMPANYPERLKTQPASASRP